MQRADATPMTIVDRIAASAELGGSVTFIQGQEVDRTSWHELHSDAQRVAHRLSTIGVREGDRVALLGPTTRSLVTTLQAVWLAGVTVVVLPLPMRLGSLSAFVDQTRNRIKRAQISLLVVDDQLAKILDLHEGDPPTITLGALEGPELAAGLTSELDLQRLAISAGSGTIAADSGEADPSSLMALQFTSGSTSEPRGVMLHDRTIAANIDGIVACTGLSAETDVMVSWLPLYHDMGLIGFLTLPMVTGTSLVLGAPQDFLASPGKWMRWVSDFGGTVTAGPNFSWALATRAIKRESGLNLSRLRVALNGAESVDPGAVRAFVEAAKPHGFDPGAVFPAFGMAETAIAAAFPPVGRGLMTDLVDRHALEHDREATAVSQVGEGQVAEGTVELVRLGYPIAGLEFRIVDRGDVSDTSEARVALADRQVGELHIRGTSVTPGYFNDPDATRASFEDGWLKTGDLAYLDNGELVICGRIKDLIIVGGRNISPVDIERAVGVIDGVRVGNVAAFAVDGRFGKQSIVVAAEVKGGDTAAIRDQVRVAVLDEVGVPARDVVLLAPGALPKTSSGKLQRQRCAELYENEQFEPV